MAETLGQALSSVATAAGARGLLVGLLVATAVLSWPRRVSPESAVLAGSTISSGDSAGDAAGDGRRFDDSAGRAIWHEDPVVLYRRWRLRRDREHLLDGVLVLLDSMAPALAMGLPPSRALALASEAGAGDPLLSEPAPGRRRGVSELDRLTGSLTAAADRGGALAGVWVEWARLTRSPEISFVASAWALSEQHGAPLAVAVERAAAGLREARARQRKVRVAVAGPRATVTVLTVLPLTGPAFGLACGIDPATLYLGSPLAAVSAALGVALIGIGRLWCRRMIRRAVAS
ncbi:type II secretion system F family protein [Humibacillus xanthopallidus]|uniref:type II secretion system F family protein n=1 Tax=Humibacillus xanthopallidus TaxID=412689 RepID=UPI00384ABDB0